MRDILLHRATNVSDFASFHIVQAAATFYIEVRYADLYPREALLARVFYLCVCVCVCLLYTGSPRHRHRHPCDDPCEDVGENVGVGVVECGL